MIINIIIRTYIYPCLWMSKIFFNLIILSNIFDAKNMLVWINMTQTLVNFLSIQLKKLIIAHYNTQIRLL